MQRAGRLSEGVWKASRCSSSSTPEMANSQSDSGSTKRRCEAAAAAAAPARDVVTIPVASKPGRLSAYSLQACWLAVTTVSG